MSNSTTFVITPTFRAAFVAVFRPAKSMNPGAEPKYGVTMLFPKDSDIAELKKLAADAVVAKWGPDKTKWPKGLHNPIGDGDEKADWSGFAGHHYIRAVSKFAPSAVDQKLEAIAPLNGEDVLYSGCYCRAQVNAFAWENSGKRGVSFGITAIQKVKDGERFGGRVDASKVFDKVATTKDDPANYASDASADPFSS